MKHSWCKVWSATNAKTFLITPNQLSAVIFLQTGCTVQCSIIFHTDDLSSFDNLSVGFSRSLLQKQ